MMRSTETKMAWTAHTAEQAETPATTEHIDTEGIKHGDGGTEEKEMEMEMKVDGGEKDTKGDVK
jgi:hypothetical protein